MNIFYLDRCPTVAAQMQCNKHVVKMILETAQMLCAAHHMLGSALPNMYRLTHKNHPSSVWVRSSQAAYNWTYAHFKALCAEYTHRYDRVHLTQTKLSDVLSRLPDDIPNVPFVDPPMCMPEEFHSNDVVHSYQKYYCFKRDTIDMAWTRRDSPDFFKNVVDAI